MNPNLKKLIIEYTCLYNELNTTIYLNRMKYFFHETIFRNLECITLPCIQIYLPQEIFPKIRKIQIIECKCNIFSLLLQYLDVFPNLEQIGVINCKQFDYTCMSLIDYKVKMLNKNNFTLKINRGMLWLLRRPPPPQYMNVKVCDKRRLFWPA